MEERVKTNQSHLEPFHHQVAGQSLVFRYDPHTICKSLIPRELQFYKTLPDVLKPHVPEYRGVVDIELDNSGNGDREEEGEDNGAKHPLATQRLLDKVARSHGQDNVYYFILLENIVANYQQPCILDLKLGTRQHGDDAPLDKVQYQVKKCRSTTSALLGVRLCGMKLYQPETGNHMQIDKAEGRNMRKDDFRESMFQFLFDGRHFRRDLIPSLLLQLQTLKTAIAQLPTYRFYSSSLLIVYDGTGVSNQNTDQGLSVNEVEHSCELKNSSVGGFNECNSDNDVVTHNSRTSATKREVQNELAQSAGQEDSDHRESSRPLDANGHLLPSGINGTAELRSKHNGVQDHLLSYSGPLPELSQEHCTDAVNGTFEECHINRNETTSVHVPMDLQNCDTRSCNTSDARISSAQISSRRSTQNCASETPVIAADNISNELSAQLPPVNCKSKVDVRLVDFAHTTYAGFENDTVVHKGVDHGCLLGLQTLIDTFSQLYDEDSCETLIKRRK